MWFSTIKKPRPLGEMGDSTARSGKEQDDPEHHAALQSKEVPKGQGHRRQLEAVPTE